MYGVIGWLFGAALAIAITLLLPAHTSPVVTVLLGFSISGFGWLIGRISDGR